MCKFTCYAKALNAILPALNIVKKDCEVYFENFVQIANAKLRKNEIPYHFIIDENGTIWVRKGEEELSHKL